MGPPLPAADLLTFVKAAFSCRQAAGGRVFVHSRVGLDSCLLYATLETMLAQGPTNTAIPVPFPFVASILIHDSHTFLERRFPPQIRYHGDVNIPHYSRHLSAAHGHALASADLYVYVMF